MSKTVWANVVALGAAVAALFGLDLSADMQQRFVEFVVLGMPALNVVLRLVTKDAIVLSK